MTLAMLVYALLTWGGAFLGAALVLVWPNEFRNPLVVVACVVWIIGMTIAGLYGPWGF